MKLKIEITLDNAAFEGPNGGPEVARILREFADRLVAWELPEFSRDADFPRLRDINGNKVGTADVIDD